MAAIEALIRELEKAFVIVQRRDILVPSDGVCVVGEFEDAAFKVIRKRDWSEIQSVVNGSVKVHQLMRVFPKLIKNPDAKKELLKLNDISSDLTEEEKKDHNGNILSERDQDKVWADNNREEINRYFVKALRHQEHKEEQDTTVNLLEAALAKLNHKNMDSEGTTIDDLGQALTLTRTIIQKAKELERIFYHAADNFEKLKQSAGKLKVKPKKK